MSSLIMKKNLIIVFLSFVFLSCNSAFVQNSYTAISRRVDKVVTTAQPRFVENVERINTEGYRQRPPEEAAVKIPSEIQNQLEDDPVIGIYSLVEHLIAGTEDPFLQVKVLHDWVALNINYDVFSFFAGRIPDQDAISVLNRRNAVCEGYSQLFNELSRIAGIRSFQISGYARGYGSSIFDEAKPEKSNHAWNAVLINGVWYLLDATWNSGSLDGRNFKKEYSAAYLFLEPERMIYTHFPEAPGHQILPEPFTAQEFSQLPFYRGQFFAAGLLPFNDISRLNPVADHFILQFEAPSNLNFSTQLLDRNGKAQEQRTFVYRSKNMATMKVTFPEPGLWALRIYAGETGSNQYGSLVEIGLKSSTGTKEIFPLIYETFTDHQVELQSPLNGPLMSGSKVSFSISLPGYSDAFISTGSQRYSLIKEPETDNFHLDLTIPRVKELTIFGRQNHESREYNAILTYPVDF